MFIRELCRQRAGRLHHTRANGWDTHQGRRPASFTEGTVQFYIPRGLYAAESGDPLVAVVSDVTHLCHADQAGQPD